MARKLELWFKSSGIRCLYAKTRKSIVRHTEKFENKKQLIYIPRVPETSKKIVLSKLEVANKHTMNNFLESDF